MRRCRPLREPLERDGDLYRNSPAADRFLAGNAPPTCGHCCATGTRTATQCGWTSPKRWLAGRSTRCSSSTRSSRRSPPPGIEAVLAGPANALGRVVDFSSCLRLLDVGGGTGPWSIATARHHPHLRGSIVELPAVAVLAEQRIVDVRLADRLTVVAADAMADDLPGGHDTVLVANLVHYWSPETNAKLLRRIRAAVELGAKLLLADFWTDPTHTEPVQAALMAGEFAAGLREGDVYSGEEVRDWLPAAGWRFLEHLPLAGPQSLILAEAV